MENALDISGVQDGNGIMALGLIETKGLLAAIECADAMLKAADVRLLEKKLASGGLVTISIAGEVAAVRASVDAAVAAVRRIKGAILVSQHVIARPDAELEGIVALRPADARPGQRVVHELSKLKKMNVNRLRRIAGSLGDLSLTREEVACAGRKDLIEAISKAERLQEE
jgi:microcompartment protein CcmL/EutN